MVDKTNAATFQGAGTLPEMPAAPAAADQPVGTSVAQPQYVTLEQAQQLAKEAADEAFRRAQSLYSKGQAGFEKKVQADLKNLEKALDLQKKIGIAVTPEQENNLRQQVINQAFIEGEQPTSATPGQAPAQEPEGDEPPDPVTASAWRMMEAAGIDIGDEDPEFKEIVKADAEDPYEFLRSIEAAINAKRTRLGTSTQTQPQPTRMPTNAGSAGQISRQLPDIKDSDALWSEVKRAGKL